MRGRVLGAAALAAALAIGTTACGGGNPKPKPVASSSAAQPSPATRSDQAEAAARKWLGALNTAQQTYDVSELDRLSSPNCRPCSIISDYIESIGTSGGYLRGGLWEHPRFQTRSETSSKVVLDIRVRVGAQQVRESRNAQEKTFEGGPSVPKQLTLEPHSGDWIVVDLKQEDML